MRALERAAAAQIKPLPINIDGALAAVLHDIGVSAATGTLIFIIGRVAGLTAEVAEEYAREKPMRIHIPVEYDGDPPACPARGLGSWPTRTITPDEQQNGRRPGVARAGGDARRRIASTRPRSIGSAAPWRGPAATRPPRRGSPR